METVSYLNDSSVERWLRYKGELTKKYYPLILGRFIENLTGPQLGLKDPASLIAWARAQPDNIEVQDLIEKFGESQPRTVQLVRMSALRSFYKRNGVSLPSMASGRQYQKNFHRGYKREEIQAVLGYLNSPVQKLYVLVAKDTGLRAHDIFDLRYRHLKRDLEAKQEYVHLYLEPEWYNRRKASGRTFIGPETVKLLKECIAEKLIGNFEEVKTTDNDGRVRVERKYLGLTDDSKVFPFVYPTIAGSLALAREKARLDPLIQPSHGLRKFFENCLDRAGLDYDLKRQLEGRSTGVRSRHYTDRDIESLREEYVKAYSFLDLREAAVTPQVVRELQELDREKTKHIEALKDEITKKDRDLLELRSSTVSKADFEKRMDEMTQFMWRELGKRIGGKIGVAQKDTTEPSAQPVPEARNKIKSEKKPSK
jgi:hypothetical protein